MDDKTKRQRFLVLDIIRCLSSGLVITSHVLFYLNSPYARYYGWPNFYYVTIGGIGVTILLFLSGLVLQLNYGNKVTTYSNFILKRIKRIYSVYFISFIISVIYIFIFNSFNCKVCSLKNILLGISGFQAFFGEWGGPILRTGWFIGLIILLYFLFPLVSYLSTKRALLTIFFIFIISFFSRYFIGKYNLLSYRALDWFPLNRIFEFSLGVFAARFIPQGFWSIGSNLKNMGKFFHFSGEISFPLFLLHYPFLSLLGKLISLGMNTTSAVFLYLTFSFLVSWLILSVQKLVFFVLKLKPR